MERIECITMKIKQKLRLGFGLLVLAVVVFGALSLMFLKQMSHNSALILEDNYSSLRIVRQMREVMDVSGLPLPPQAINEFESLLQQEENHLTEEGEKKIVTNLRRSFEVMKVSSLPLSVHQQAEQQLLTNLRSLADVNLDAVVRKSNTAQNAIQNAAMFIGLMAAICFFILFIIVFNLIGFFEEPFRQLTEGFQNISYRRYVNLLNYDRNDELGSLYTAFNDMVLNLDKYQKQFEEMLKIERLKVDALMKHSADPVLVVSADRKLIALNPAAETTLGLSSRTAVGKHLEMLPDHLLKEIAESKQNGEVLVLNNASYSLAREPIEVPPDHLSSLQEGEISVSGELVQEVLFLKKNESASDKLMNKAS